MASLELSKLKNDKIKLEEEVLQLREMIAKSMMNGTFETTTDHKQNM
jgi:hypothetical protein